MTVISSTAVNTSPSAVQWELRLLGPVHLRGRAKMEPFHRSTRLTALASQWGNSVRFASSALVQSRHLKVWNQCQTSVCCVQFDARPGPESGAATRPSSPLSRSLVEPSDTFEREALGAPKSGPWFGGEVKKLTP